MCETENEPTTRDKIVKVIEDMEKADAQHIMTISYVAREVGVSGSNIHNRYPDLADRIRRSSGKIKDKDAKYRLAKQRGTIKEEKRKRAKLRLELLKKNELLRKCDSVIASLQFENDQLKALNKKKLP